MFDQGATSTAEPTPAELVDHLTKFDGPPQQFLLHLVAVQCRIGHADSGAILRSGQSGPEILSVYPALENRESPPVWLAQSAELLDRVVKSKETMKLPVRVPNEIYGLEAPKTLLLMPLNGEGGVRGMQAFVLGVTDEDSVEQSRARLELTATLLSLYEMRLTMQRRGADLKRMGQACKVLAAVNEQRRYRAAAMALCDHLASHWEATRVSVGLLKGRYVKLAAMSHTEKFTRKMTLVQSIESAMEECVDQDTEVVWPLPEGASMIGSAAGHLANQHGPSAVLSLPLRREGKVVGTITLEREADKPFAIDEAEALRMACDLATPRLIELSEHDQWIGARLAGASKRGLGWLVGSKQTWAKAAAVAVTAAIACAVLIDGPYRVEAPFTVEAVTRQIISTPYSGYLVKADALPDDNVVAGVTVLAELDTSELRLQLAEAVAQRQSFLTEANIAHRDNEIAQARIAEAEALRVSAQIDLLNWRIDQSKIISPISGTITTGDWTKQVGALVEIGQALYEVAPLEELRVLLEVAEDGVADLQIGQVGEMATVAKPGDYIAFEIDMINPVAQVKDRRNVFEVRATLSDRPDYLAPGMSGVAKVDIEQRPYAWIWTRDLVNWVRMKLWL